jgi:hypothetical protein
MVNQVYVQHMLLPLWIIMVKVIGTSIPLCRVCVTGHSSDEVIRVPMDLSRMGWLSHHLIFDLRQVRNIGRVTREHLEALEYEASWLTRYMFNICSSLFGLSTL